MELYFIQGVFEKENNIHNWLLSRSFMIVVCVCFYFFQELFEKYIKVKFPGWDEKGFKLTTSRVIHKIIND